MDHVTRAQRFVDLHAGDELFVMANPIDVGSAVLFESLGFAALGTSSAAFANSLGRPDGARAVSRDEAIEHARQMLTATSLPVSGDLENGYGDEPEAVAQTVNDAIAAGLAGCCIEDATGTDHDPIYTLEAAAERIRAGAEAAGDRPFVLVARAENYLHDRPDLADTIRRLQSFQAAGASALYAPGITALKDLRVVVSEIDVPLNVLVGLRGQDYSLSDLADIGVRRVSVGSGFNRVASAAVHAAAVEFLAHGSCAPMVTSSPDLDELFSSRGPTPQ